MLIGIASIAAIFSILYFIATNIIIRPINRVVEGLKDIAQERAILPKGLKYHQRMK